MHQSNVAGNTGSSVPKRLEAPSDFIDHIQMDMFKTMYDHAVNNKWGKFIFYGD